MNLVKWQALLILKLIHINPLHFYILNTKNQKEKLMKQSRQRAQDGPQNTVSG